MQDLAITLFHLIPILKMSESPFSFQVEEHVRVSDGDQAGEAGHPRMHEGRSPARREDPHRCSGRGPLTNHVHSIVGFVGYPLSHNISLSYSRNLSVVLLTASWANPLSRSGLTPYVKLPNKEQLL